MKRLDSFLFIVFFFLLLSDSPVLSQKTRIFGYIYDSKTKETLIGATVFDAQNKQGTITNSYGFYSFTPKNQNIVLEFSYIGYQKQILSLNLQKDTAINIYLTASTELEEVTITDERYEQRFVRQEVPGKIEINPQVVAKMPTLTGEADLLKAVQMLPGVKSGTEGTTGLYVRGGNSDQNLYLIDGIEVYNPNHLMGFISAFNTDAVKNIEFYKGGFPAEFGGRASSVMDIRMKDGNTERIKGDFSIGLISAKVNVEGPIKTDKTTFSFSFRRTYLDLLIKPLIWYRTRNDDKDLGFAYHFYDINAKVKHRFNPQNTLTLSFYKGKDKYGFSTEERYAGTEKSQATVSWGNTIATLDWTHQFSSQLFSNLSISYNRYKSLITSEYDNKEDYGEITTFHTKFNFNSGVEDITLKNNYNYYLNGWNSFNLGVNYTYHHYTPEITRAVSIENGAYITAPYTVDNQDNAHEIILYGEDVMNFTDKISLREGLRFDYYNVSGTIHASVQPRISFRYSLIDNFSLKAGYAMMNQNIHLLSNGLFSLPTDLWVPVTKKIKPITSHQISIGGFTQILRDVNISLEGYYKWLINVIDYKDGVSSFNNSENWQQNVAQGNGKSYGMEFTAQKNKGNFTGWIAYTLSWSKRQYERGEINNGDEFYDRFDVRHQFNAVASFEISNRWEITAAFVINSGSRTNVPVANYYNPVENKESLSHWYDSGLISIYGPRNNFRMPSYQRLDLSIANHKPVKYGVRTWALNVYNAYNYKNAFFVFPSDEPNKLKAFSIMPVIPTVSYSFKF
ncbi:MAG: TonB-dependent receptor [Bacteroidales bacterium]|nr:TonB-dependent receptor [Bacteroidales bacterium]